jgi:hypothetical protein
MKFRWLAVTLVVLGSAYPSSAVRAQGTKDILIEGQVKIGVHKFKLDNSALYQIEIKAKDFSPGVGLSGLFLQNMADFVKERKTFRALFSPPKSQEYTLTVTPTIGFGTQPPEGLLDYTVTLKTIKLDDTPILKKGDKLTANEPKYQKSFNKSSHFKAYLLTMKAGQTYLIDMVRSDAAGSSLDPYLYLENPKMNIVAQDDDSGGNLNARILYRATMDGEYQIIASGLSERSSVGDYTLTVRTVKEEK